MSPISPISSIPLPEAVQPARPSGGGDFQALFSGAVRQVEMLQNNANQAVEQFLSGEGGELHSTILQTQKAELSMEMFLQTRNKIVQAYQEVMRMQL